MTAKQCMEAGCTSPVVLDSLKQFPMCRKHDRESRTRVERMMVAGYAKDITDLMTDARTLKRFGGREREVRTRVGQARMTNHELIERRRNLREMEASDER